MSTLQAVEKSGFEVPDKGGNAAVNAAFWSMEGDEECTQQSHN